MNPNSDTVEKIIELVKQGKQVPAKDIVNHIGISKQAVFRHLSKLVKQDVLEKIGKPPKVFYVIKKQEKPKQDYIIPDEDKDVIEKNFLTITSLGEGKKGFNGFVGWCQKRGMDVEKEASKYVADLKKYNKLRKDGLINGMVKMKATFDKVYLDNLFYLDFYAIPHFGKTKLGQTLLYAKQGGNKSMIKDLSEEIRPKVNNLIKKYKVDAVAFVPPTIKREVQFIKELENNLSLRLGHVKITKVKTPIIIAQKTLNKLGDRVENAKKTFVLEAWPKYKSILLIDDAVGSGATLNEIAAKIKAQKKFKGGKVIGLVITGSFKGFDVISEV